MRSREKPREFKGRGERESHSPISTKPSRIFESIPLIFIIDNYHLVSVSLSFNSLNYFFLSCSIFWKSIVWINDLWVIPELWNGETSAGFIMSKLFSSNLIYELSISRKTINSLNTQAAHAKCLKALKEWQKFPREQAHSSEISKKYSNEMAFSEKYYEMRKNVKQTLHFNFHTVENEALDFFFCPLKWFARIFCYHFPVSFNYAIKIYVSSFSCCSWAVFYLWNEQTSAQNWKMKKNSAKMGKVLLSVFLNAYFLIALRSVGRKKTIHETKINKKMPIKMVANGKYIAVIFIFFFAILVARQECSLVLAS